MGRYNGKGNIRFEIKTELHRIIQYISVLTKSNVFMLSLLLLLYSTQVFCHTS
jgi:hypothetical protein